MLEFLLITVGIFLFLMVAPFLASHLSDPNFINLEYFFNKIFELFGGTGGVDFSGVISFIKIFLSIVSIILITVIIYSQMRLREIEAEQHKKLKEVIEVDPTPHKNERWDKVIMHGNSPNSSDWRTAIIEADSMLDELLDKMGYAGTS